MQPAAPLKLAALDGDDLVVVSAHVQDAVLKVRDIVYEPRRGRFALAMNRFAWEVAGGRRVHTGERRRTALHFDRVLDVKTQGLSRTAPDLVLELLAVHFEPAEAPAGAVTLTFAGGPQIRLTVECIEAQLADLGAAWQTRAVPAHDLREPRPGSGVPSK